MDQLVEFERINLSRVQACKPIAHMLEKKPKLVLVVLADQLARRTATSSLAFDIADPHTVGHARKSTAPRPGHTIGRDRHGAASVSVRQLSLPTPHARPKCVPENVPK